VAGFVSLVVRRSRISLPVAIPPTAASPVGTGSPAGRGTRFVLAEVLVHERGRHAAFTDGRRDALHVAAPDLPAAEDARTLVSRGTGPGKRFLGTGAKAAINIGANGHGAAWRPLWTR
jgi:hypothetical protein